MKVLRMMIVLLFVILIPVTGMAQADTGTKFVISTNPIIDMFEWYNAEFELKVSDTGTMGLSGSYVTFEQSATEFTTGTEVKVDDKYMNVYGFYRYYPSGAALKGFFFGGRAGFNSVTANAWGSSTLAGVDDVWVEADATFFGIGIDIGYNWLLGAEERFYVSLGMGAIRLFGGDLDEDIYDVQFTLPTIRLINIGIGF